MPAVCVLDPRWSTDMSCNQDTDNNTILTLLADFKPPATTAYRSTTNDYYASEAALRMAKLYYDRYQYIRDWANSQGKTALHAASMRGSEEIVRVRNSPFNVETPSTKVVPLTLTMFIWLTDAV